MIQQKDSSLAYIQYMKFARRTEGIKAGRAVFKIGRLAPACTYHLFVASALMEWQVNKDTQVARNVFELGMSKFGTDTDYVLEYIKFLSHLNEENNLRVLFEKAVNSIPKEKAHEIWNLYIQFEYNYGDLAAIMKIENRKSKVYPETEVSGILPLVNRFKYLDLWPCNNAELDSFEKLPEPKFEAGKSEDTKGEEDVLHGKPNPKLAKFPRPDLALMIPFKNETMMPQFGGVPDIIAQLIVNLPAATTWQGPIVDIEGFMSLLVETPLPPPPAELLQEQQNAANQQQQQQQKKRKTDDDDDEEESAPININAPPSNDLFRQRQRAKMQKKSVV